MAEPRTTSERGGDQQEPATILPEIVSGNHPDAARHVQPTRRAFYLGCITLFALALWTFWPAIYNDFFYWYGDDPLYVLENSHVNTGLTWDNIAWAFRSTDHSNWHPLTWISHMIDCDLFGLQPAGHHLTNILLHSGNAVLLFVWLRGITGSSWRAWIVALLFALHPLRVESVAWISERKDVLSVFFLLLTLWMYSRYVGETQTAKTKSRLAYALALTFFICGLMSKATLVTLPFVLILLDYWPTMRAGRLSLSKLVFEKWPFFMAAMGACAVTYFTQHHWGFIKSLNDYALLARLENAPVSYVRYLGHVLWPVHLASWYPLSTHWPWFMVAGSLLLLLLISVAVLVTRRKFPYFFAGWFWYLGTMVPMIGIVQVGDQALADRFTYVPMIGLLLGLVWGVADSVKKLPRPHIVTALATVIVVVSGLFLTRDYVLAFKDSATIWRHNMALTGRRGFAQYAYALALNHQGHTQDAIQELEDLLEVKPEWAEAHANLAGMLDARGRRMEALMHYYQAVKLQPDNAGIHLRLATLLVETGELQDAIAHYELALQADRDYAPERRNIDLAAPDEKRVAAATRAFREAIRFRPDYSRAHNEWGVALGKMGRYADGIPHFQEALLAQPDFAEAHNNLGVALLHLKRVREAINEFKKALEILPHYPDARRNLEQARQSLAVE